MRTREELLREIETWERQLALLYATNGDSVLHEVYLAMGNLWRQERGLPRLEAELGSADPQNAAQDPPVMHPKPIAFYQALAAEMSMAMAAILQRARGEPWEILLLTSMAVHIVHGVMYKASQETNTTVGGQP